MTMRSVVAVLFLFVLLSVLFVVVLLVEHMRLLRDFVNDNARRRSADTLNVVARRHVARRRRQVGAGGALHDDRVVGPVWRTRRAAVLHVLTVR